MLDSRHQFFIASVPTFHREERNKVESNEKAPARLGRASAMRYLLIVGDA